MKAVEPGLGVSIAKNFTFTFSHDVARTYSLSITPPLTQVQMIINLRQVIVNGTVGIAGWIRPEKAVKTVVVVAGVWHDTGVSLVSD